MGYSFAQSPNPRDPETLPGHQLSYQVEHLTPGLECPRTRGNMETVACIDIGSHVPGPLPGTGSALSRPYSVLPR